MIFAQDSWAVLGPLVSSGYFHTIPTGPTRGEIALVRSIREESTVEPEVLAAYLDAATALHGLPLTAEQRTRALMQLERFALIAGPLLALPLQPSDEPILGPLP